MDATIETSGNRELTLVILAFNAGASPIIDLSSRRKGRILEV